jgi:hypothetical protein
MADLASVIVPIYNVDVEAYLAECIESILNQTYVSLELLLIDDGSSDHSAQMKDLNKISKALNPVYQVIKGSFIELANTLYQSEFPAMSPSCKLYDRSLFNNVRFHEGIIYEDGILFYEIIDQIEQMAIVKSNSYYYRTAENSTLTSKISQKNFDVFKKNAILNQFFEEKHPEELAHFYQRSLNLNDVIAVKSYQDD